MPSIQCMHKCKKCARPTMHIKQQASHLLHFVLSIFTAGCWLPIWFLCSLKGPPRCTECGGKYRGFLS